MLCCAPCCGAAPAGSLLGPRLLFAAHMSFAVICCVVTRAEREGKNEARAVQYASQPNLQLVSTEPRSILQICRSLCMELWCVLRNQMVCLASPAFSLRMPSSRNSLHSRLGEVQICAFVTPASALLSPVLLHEHNCKAAEDVCISAAGMQQASQKELHQQAP